MKENTRAGLAKALEGMGVSYDTAEAILGLTAPVRHQIRTDYVQKTVVLEAKKMTFASGRHPDAFEAEVLGVALCALDQFGLGGRQGLTGKATARIPQFKRLGKGRKQAWDGGAWSEAIECASNQMCHRIRTAGRWKAGDEFIFAPVLPEGGDPDPGWTGIGVALTPDGREILPIRGEELLPWARVAATLGAADSALSYLCGQGACGAIEELYLDELRDRPNWPVICGGRLSFVGDPESWSQVVDVLNDRDPYPQSSRYYDSEGGDAAPLDDVGEDVDLILAGEFGEE